MKIGIITITNGENYGNRLQNYAVQEALKETGAEVETVHKVTNVFDAENFVYLNKLRLKKLLHYHLTVEERRRLSFYRFTKRYIKRSRYVIKDSAPEKLDSSYDCFVAGSDQVWNPYLAYVTCDNFLTFTSAEKKVAFAPSIAVEDIPEEKKKEYAAWIQDFRLLSVREKEGATLIYRLCGRKAEVLLDPTFYLSASQWRRIEKRVKMRENRYILAYFLGEYTPEYKERVEEFARFAGCVVYRLQTEEHFQIAPDEFLYLVDHASIVCTDSFHGTAFSIIFKKNFVVFRRKEAFADMGSRLHTLLQRFDMEDRYWERVGCNSVKDTDFCKSEAIIEVEREKTRDFLSCIYKGERYA